MDPLRQYLSSHCDKVAIKKHKNSYVCLLKNKNPKYDREELYDYNLDADYVPFIIGTPVIEFVISLFAFIPNYIGIIAFTLLHILAILFSITTENKYYRITVTTIIVVCFILALIVIHWIFVYNPGNSANIYFHKVYPEYLFKFKF